MSRKIKLSELSKLINENLYINNCKSNKKKDINSLSSLIEIKMSQSDCIRLGIAIEKLFKDIILEFTNVKDIKNKNIKGVKEKDHLFKDEKKKIIYYAELKGNLNLDTEKSISTSNKCLAIVNELQIKYPKYEIKWCLLGSRYLSYNDIPKCISKKYKKIENNTYGINQYINMFNINFKFTEKTYKKYLNEIAVKMFCE